MNSVSPVSTSGGSLGESASLTSTDRLSGVWPGVSRKRSTTRPTRSSSAVAYRAVRKRDAGPRPEHHLGAGALGELAVAAHEVGVQVRLDHVADREALRLRLVDVLVDVAPGVDDHGLAQRTRSCRRPGPGSPR